MPDARSMHSRVFGIKVTPILFTPDELNKKSKNSLIKESLTNGRLNAGIAPERFRNG